jgi:probable HAF family extracellular repeat protein
MKLRLAVAHALAVGLLLGRATPASCQSAPYKVTEIPTLGGIVSTANAVSNSGYVVGASASAGGDLRAYRFSVVTGAMRDLGTLGGAASVANAVTEAGDVVGRAMTSGGQLRAFLWKSGIEQMHDLGTLGGTNSSALGVNNIGQAVGWCENLAGDARPCLFDLSANTVKELATLGGFNGAAFAINDAKTVVGHAETASGTTHAVRWDCSQATCPVTDLGAVRADNSYAHGITGAGIVFGVTETEYQVVNGAATTTGNPNAFSVQPAASSSTTSTVLLGGNRSGVYVGIAETSDGVSYAALIFGSSTKGNLNTSIPAGSGWTLNEATSINDGGVIVGNGTMAGSDRGFVLLNSTAPQVLSIAPASGTIAGGTPVTITGLNFAAGATVKFGAISATDVVVVNSSTITARTPASAVGLANVVVTSSSNQVGSLAGGYTFVDPATLPTMATDRSALAFGATRSGAGFAAQTSSQTVRLTQTGAGLVTWTAAANAPWITVSPASGSGSATLTIGISVNSSLPASGKSSAAIALTFSGAATTSGTVDVDLLIKPDGSSDAPFGSLDTPVNNTTGLNGSIAVTGWALDDVEVRQVEIWREPNPADPPGAVFGGPAPQGGKVFVGYASLVNGARPDVEMLYRDYPFRGRAGWGYLLLTRGLIWDGKGPFKLYAIGGDRDGHLALLGTTTIAVDNASATKPFGSIDTPGQGATASGIYANTGWVLTPNAAATIPADKVQVAIDGVFVSGTPSMSDRADISGGFPQFATTGSGRGMFIDMTKYTEGVHTIGWLVTDSTGTADGVGSRYFSVATGNSGLRAAETEASTADVEALPLDATALRARRGWDAETPLAYIEPALAGTIALTGTELDRIEMMLEEPTFGEWIGWLRVGDERRPLPVGSHLTRDGRFTWQPGVAFIGSYDLVFVRRVNGVAASRREVRIKLEPRSGR